MTRFAVPFILLSITGTILGGFINTIIVASNTGIPGPLRSTIYFLFIDMFMFIGLIKLQLKKNSAARRIFPYFNFTSKRRIYPSRVDALGRNVVEFDKEEAAHIYFDQLKRTW